MAFIRADRLPAKRVKSFWTGPPHLAIEILSPDDLAAESRTKVHEYLSHGVPLIVLVNPDNSTATLHRPHQPPVTCRGAEPVDLDDVIPGFRCTVSEIFE